MALRDKLRERVQPYLQPGEQVEQVSTAQGGVHPQLYRMFGLLGALVLAPMTRNRIVAVTNQAILVLEAGKLSANTPTARGVVARLRRQTVIGPPMGVWARVQLGDEKVYVHRRFHRDIKQANERTGAAYGTA